MSATAGVASRLAHDASTPEFVHGDTELYLGDCLEWLAHRAECSIHGVVTDPPYGIYEYTAEQQDKLRVGTGGVWRQPPAFDGHRHAPLPRFTVLSDTDLAAITTFFRSWAVALRRVLVPGAHVLVASNPLLSPYAATGLAVAGLERRGEIIRLVTTMRGGDRPKEAHLEFPEVTVMPKSRWEPWLLYREPLAAKTVAENLRKYKTGGLRRPTADVPFSDVIMSHPTGRIQRAIGDSRLVLGE